MSFIKKIITLGSCLKKRCRVTPFVWKRTRSEVELKFHSLMWHLKFLSRKLKTKLHKIISCIYRHQASESNTEDGEEKANKQAKIKNAANLLQQRKMLQRNLRNLQQHTLSREILSGKISFSKFNEKHCIRDICILNNFFFIKFLDFIFETVKEKLFPFLERC